MTAAPGFPFDGDTCFACRKTGLVAPGERPYQNDPLAKAGFQTTLCGDCAAFFYRGGYRLVGLVQSLVLQDRELTREINNHGPMFARALEEAHVTLKERFLVMNPIIENLFTYHPPTDIQREKYERIREAAKMLAYEIDAACEPGPDRTAAMRHVREAVMTANASIATNNAQY
jgi:hypothetical protein